MHTLIARLPPPNQDTPEVTLARNHAAIARIAALAPVNADEAEVAAQSTAAQAMLGAIPSARQPPQIPQ